MVTLDRLQRQKTEIVLLGEKYGARNIRVFGSVARGDNRQESDVEAVRTQLGRSDDWPNRPALPHPPRNRC